MFKILYNSDEIRKELIKLFSSSNYRRVAITAFVGEGAENYLPKDPKGLSLICWPKAGGTNPHVLDKLHNRGVKISFVDSLHMKLYWAESAGAIITSANLSNNALGGTNLKEVGILIPSDEIDIDEIISLLNRRDLSVRELEKLYKEHDVFYSNRQNNYVQQKSSIYTFAQWYETSRAHTWKISYWEEESEFSSTAEFFCQIDLICAA